MIYTRYLYDKCCVEYSLFVSLLQEHIDEALFWALELFHSGFSEELVVLIWEHYYTLYAPFYINLESHLFKFTNLWLKNKCNETYIATMIHSLCSRNASIDFYFTYKSLIPPPKQYEVAYNNIDAATNVGDVMNIANDCVTEHNLFKTRCKNALSNIDKIFEKLTFLDMNIYKNAIKSRLITGLFLLDKNNKLDPKRYTIKETEDILQYKTKPVIELKGWKIPRRECIYTLNLKPSTSNKEIWHYDNWLYFASKTPLWHNRISRHKGRIEHALKKVKFDKVDNEESFFNFYNYEPDEQSLEVQSKWLGKRTYESWDQIYEKHKCEPYNEWLTINNSS
jgi:hypothetical protein